jgi:NAD-dependent SIR2 family protein deacetylase
MARTIFILGAGASARAGAPMMNSFIEAATRTSEAKLDQEDVEAFDLVFRARAQLQSVFAKSKVDINNIESLFGAFEMAALIGRLGNLPPSEVCKLPAAMARLIARTIEASVRFPTRQHNREAEGRVLPPEPYGEFSVLLNAIQQRESVAVMTFNYDLCLDYALYSEGVPFDYCLTEPNATNKLPLLKLHGSLNWGRCEKCASIVAWEMQHFFRTQRWRTYDLPSYVRLTVSNLLSKHSHCETSLPCNPVIVPPTWNKGRFHTDLSVVWRSAAKHLSEAERIFVIGYSLPKTDEFFHYFYALGSVGDAIPTLFSIVNPDRQTEARFSEILGPTVTDLHCARMIEGTFEDSTEKIGRELGFESQSENGIPGSGYKFRSVRGV